MREAEWRPASEKTSIYSKFLNGCQSGSACPWRVGTCQWRVDGDRRLSYWLDLLGVIRKIERWLTCANVRSGFSQWERRWNPSSTWNYVSTRKQQSTLQLTTIKKFAVSPPLGKNQNCFWLVKLFTWLHSRSPSETNSSTLFHDPKAFTSLAHWRHESLIKDDVSLQDLLRPWVRSCKLIENHKKCTITEIFKTSAFW